MKIHWYQAPILAIAALASWAANLFRAKPPQPESISQWSDTTWTDLAKEFKAMDSTFGSKK